VTPERHSELGFQFKSGGKHLCTGCPEVTRAPLPRRDILLCLSLLSFLPRVQGRIGEAEAALVEKGFRTGVVEQLESEDDAAAGRARAVVPRALRSISTPGSAGTAGDPVIAVVCASGRAVCCVLYSPLTHALRVAVASEAAGGSATISTHLAVARPVELVLEAAAAARDDDDAAVAAAAGVVSRLHARNVVRQRWVEADLRACFGDASGPAIAGAGPLAARAAQLLQGYYVSLLKGPRGLDGVSVSVINGRGGGGGALCMDLNEATLSNLEVFELSSDALSYDRAAAGGGARAPEGTLLWWLDTTLTASGRRLLREWLARPLLSVHMIRERCVRACVHVCVCVC
jgi:DNA mismatch repair ATPase MutS